MVVQRAPVVAALGLDHKVAHVAGAELRQARAPRARRRAATGRNRQRPAGSCGPCRANSAARAPDGPAKGSHQSASTSGGRSGVGGEGTGEMGTSRLLRPEPGRRICRISGLRLDGPHHRVGMAAQGPLRVEAPGPGGRRQFEQPAAELGLAQVALRARPPRRGPHAGPVGSRFFSICFQTASANIRAGRRGGSALKSGGGSAAPRACFSPRLDPVPFDQHLVRSLQPVGAEDMRDGAGSAFR